MEQKLNRRKFDKQFKLDAVRLVMEGGKSAAAVARDLGIDPTGSSRSDDPDNNDTARRGGRDSPQSRWN